MDFDFSFSGSGSGRDHAARDGLVALFGGFGTWRVLRAPPVPYLRSE